MACTDCFTGCAEITADKCVKYTGDDIPSLGICSGDSLFEVENIFISTLTSIITGAGIAPNVTLSCSLLTNLLNGGDITLSSLFQIYASAICTLDSEITALQNIVGTSSSFNTSCLTGLPSNPTRDQILQAVLNQVCNNTASITAIANDYVKASQLNTLIQQYISGASSSVQQNTKMVPYVAYEYYGPLANFDSGGVGITSAGFQKVYLCNGNNGTPDKRGRVAVGANVNIPGPSLDSAVNPSLPANSGYGFSLNTKLGEYTHTNTIAETPAHTHTTNDPGHSHPVPIGDDYTGSGVSPYMGSGQIEHPHPNNTTLSATTGITIGSTGSSQPHNNVQPSIGCLFIMYIP